MPVNRQLASLYGFRIARGKYYRNLIAIKSAEALNASLSVKASRLKESMMKGLIRAQKRIYDHMNSVSPMIPVDSGNMRRSYYCVKSTGGIQRGAAPNFTDENKDGEKLITEHAETLQVMLADAVENGKIVGPYINFGFSAYYAMYVHEMVGHKKIHWSRPGSGPKFFESALKANRDAVLKILAENGRAELLK